MNVTWPDSYQSLIPEGLRQILLYDGLPSELYGSTLVIGPIGEPKDGLFPIAHDFDELVVISLDDNTVVLLSEKNRIPVNTNLRRFCDSITFLNSSADLTIEELRKGLVRIDPDLQFSGSAWESFLRSFLD